MDPAAPNPTPRFSPEDTLLLEAFLSDSRDLLALAKRSGRPFHELLAWFDQPHIQHALKVLNDNEEHDHRSAARAHLRAVADDADTPAERRRAATSLLAALRTRAPRATEPNPSEHAAAPLPAAPDSKPSTPMGPISPIGPLRPIHASTPAANAPPPSTTPKPTERVPLSENAAYRAALETLNLDDIDDEEEDRLLDEELDRELDEELDEEAEEYAHLSTEELVALAREAANRYFAERAATPPITLPLPPQSPAP